MPETIRQKQKRQTRQKLLDVAAAQFAKQGFGVTTHAIAQAAGVSHGALFVHFPTREALIDCVVEEFFDKLNWKIHIAAKENAQIAQLLRAHLEVLEENEGFYSHLIAQLATLPPRVRNKLFAYQSTLSLHFDQALSKARGKGRATAVPAHMPFNLWMGLVHYYLQNGEMFAPGESVLGRCKEQLVQSYLAMILPDQL